jgi:hypothetical protein
MHYPTVRNVKLTYAYWRVGVYRHSDIENLYIIHMLNLTSAE